MGLMMDGDGIPIAFDLFDGSANEQPSLKPLEQKVITVIAIIGEQYFKEHYTKRKSVRSYNHVTKESSSFPVRRRSLFSTDVTSAT